MSKGSHWPMGSCCDDREDRDEGPGLKSGIGGRVSSGNCKGMVEKGKKECTIWKAKREGILGRRGWLATSDTAERVSDHWV